MKKTSIVLAILLCAILALVGCTQNSTQSNGDTETQTMDEGISENEVSIMEEAPNVCSPFAISDATIDGVPIGSNQEYVLATVGAAYTLEKVEPFEHGATGEKGEYYIYNFGTLTFTEGILTGVLVFKAAEGPRGIHIGDNIEDVIEHFCSAVEYTEDEYTIYYRANEGDEDKYTVVPASCVSSVTDEGESLSLDCFSDPNIYDKESSEYLKENYFFIEQYSCTFHFNEDGNVASYELFYGSPSE